MTFEISGIYLDFLCHHLVLDLRTQV